jgi:hypothetical protein
MLIGPLYSVVAMVKWTTNTMILCNSWMPQMGKEHKERLHGEWYDEKKLHLTVTA